MQESGAYLNYHINESVRAISKTKLGVGPHQRAFPLPDMYKVCLALRDNAVVDKKSYTKVATGAALAPWMMDVSNNYWYLGKSEKDVYYWGPMTIFCKDDKQNIDHTFSPDQWCCGSCDKAKAGKGESGKKEGKVGEGEAGDGKNEAGKGEAGDGL